MPRRCGRTARSVVITVTAAACPALVTEAGAASLDTGLVQRYGAALGAEQIGKGHNVALSPTINILRVPYWGRAAETFGEDPYLISQMAVGTCRAMIGDSFQ